MHFKMVKKKVKIASVKENGNGVDVKLDNGRSHWISNDSWKTKEELKARVLEVEAFFARKNTSQEKTEMKQLEGKFLN